MSITIQKLNKQFGNFTALNNINLEVNGGELIALLDPSGFGKTIDVAHYRRTGCTEFRQNTFSWQGG